MASTGLILAGFVVIHMIGNMQVYLGAEVFNHYAATLQGTKELLWIVRLVLLAAFPTHIFSAIVLARRSRVARPKAYESHQWLKATYAVRTMRWGGVILLLFVVFHILHLTVGSVSGLPVEHCHVAAEHGGLTCHAYQNLVAGFSNPLVASFYIVAQLCLGMHLAHGIWSMFRTFGVGNPRFDAIARRVAIVVSGAVTLGNVSIPLAVLSGLVS
jgi:succinate dehydrogenase / fumarate reductase cytochrome b subunit